MIVKTGYLLASPDAAHDSGLWFIFHHGPEGSAAIDLTRAHPDIAYRGFQSVLNIADTTPESEKVVLLGGPERPDDALLILHETGAATAGSHIINDDFSFLSYNYVLLQGRPPALTTAANRPTGITLKPQARFVVAMGYRAWEGDKLEREIAAGTWVCCPATRALVFDAGRSERRSRALRSIN